MLFSLLTAALLSATPAKASPDTTPVPLTDLVKRPEIEQLSISPDGKTLAIVAPTGDYESYLLFIDAETKKATQGFKDKGEFTMDSVVWVSDDRVVGSPARKYGGFAEKFGSGELIGVNKDATKLTFLFGSRGAMQAGSNIKNRGSDTGYAYIAQPMIDDPKFSLIGIVQYVVDGSFTELHRMDKLSGKHKKIARSPIRNGRFLISIKGEPVIAYAEDNNQQMKVYVNQGKDQWALKFDQEKDGKRIVPVEVSDDGKMIYAYESQEKGPAKFVSIDLASGKSSTLYAAERATPVGFIQAPNSNSILGLITADGEYGVHFFDPQSRIAKIHAAFQKNFPGQFAWPVSSSRNFDKIVFKVASGHNSGEYYVYDAKTNKANFLFPTHGWMEPNKMATVKPFSMKARDGLDLYGYLTLPRNAEAKNLPMVVMPHGGPHGIRDYAMYDEWAQVLASRGYAVLKVNFRGSAGYGSSFEVAGYNQWGKAMINDLTDAVHWAIKEGYADKDRIAIAGASYGGYASLISGAREPELYKAVISYVGVSDLELMFTRGDIEDSLWGRNYLKRVLSDDPAELKANSPVNMADQFQAPVLIIHGGQDDRVPVVHGKRMRDALKSAGKKVEYFEVLDEGHGFYKQKNVLAAYEKMLAFLDTALAKK